MYCSNKDYAIKKDASEIILDECHKFPFLHESEPLQPNIRLVVIEIKDMTDDLREILDNNFVSVCEGNSNSDIEIVKKRVRDLYKNKDLSWKMGATAEFFIHLYIKLDGFKQECMFFNLEERSIKKGFDGYYSKNNSEWLMESKAGSISSKSVSHATKVALAMRDLEKKVMGESSDTQNNPWQNAYNHACHCDVGTDEKIRAHIKRLADDFTEDKFCSMEKFNTIPCGTIFLSKKYCSPEIETIKSDIKNMIHKLKGNQIQVICVTQKSIDLFMKYIGME